MSPLRRLGLSASAFSAWLVLLLLGHPFGPAVHLLALATLLLFPWSAARGGPAAAAKTQPQEGDR
jgi:hypothetical protein